MKFLICEKRKKNQRYFKILFVVLFMFSFCLNVNAESCYRSSAAKGLGGRYILKTINASDVQNSFTTRTTKSDCPNCFTLQSMTVVGDKVAVCKIHKEGFTNTDSIIMLFDINSSGNAQFIGQRHLNGSLLYHCNGMATGSRGGVFVVPMKGRRVFGFSISDNNKIIFNTTKNGNKNSNVLGFSGNENLPSTIYGMAYDTKSGNFVLSGSTKLYMYNLASNKVVKTIDTIYSNQDIGAYNGMALTIYSTIYNNEWHNYIDMYNISNSSYVGSYEVNLKNELESISFYGNQLVLAYDNPLDRIYVLKSGVVDFYNDCK